MTRASATPVECRRRWEGSRGEALAATCLNWLVRGGARPDAFPVHDGRLDLRGLPAHRPSAVPQSRVGGLLVGTLSGVTTVADARWSSIDLSYSSLRSLRLHRVTIDDCVFDGADCSDWRVWTSSILNSTFIGTDLRMSALGTWHEARGNAWEGVVFEQADLRSSFFTGARIVDSSFVGSRLQDTSFRQVWMDRVKFRGLVQDVQFDGRELPDAPPPRALTDVDFSEAVLRDVDFRGCRLDNVHFPPGTLVVRSFPAVARRAIVLLSGQESLEARMFRSELENAMTWPGSPDSVGIFTMGDYLDDGGPALADLVERVLAAAQSGTD